jgi:hypothetical protein
VRVNVDEARCDELVARGELLASAALDLTDGHDASVAHRDIGLTRGSTRTIDQQSTADDEIVRLRHGPSLVQRGTVRDRRSVRKGGLLAAPHSRVRLAFLLRQWT